MILTFRLAGQLNQLLFTRIMTQQNHQVFTEDKRFVFHGKRIVNPVVPSCAADRLSNCLKRNFELTTYRTDCKRLNEVQE